VTVVSPANLPEGCQFPAHVNGTIFMVKTPPGGCVAGQSFQVPLPNDMQRVKPKFRPFEGGWKDRLVSDLFQHGIFHPSIWLSFCFPLIAVGQIIERLHLGLDGRQIRQARSQRPPSLQSNGFWVMASATLAVNLFRLLMYSQVFGIDHLCLFPINQPAGDDVIVAPDAARFFWRLDQAIVGVCWAIVAYVVRNVRYEP